MKKNNYQSETTIIQSPRIHRNLQISQRNADVFGFQFVLIAVHVIYSQWNYGSAN